MPRVLMLVNDIDSKPGTLVPWLLENHVEFDLRVGGVSDFPEPAALADYDGLVLLGGGYMPDEVDRAPWLAPEQALVAEAFRLDLPQLGICLGGQMLAYVGGGEVKAKTGAVEKGYTPITLTPAAGEDPVFSGVRPATEFVESHQDRITALPQDAVLLASSETCEIQAFRLGRAWGTQFHPEAGVDNLRRWNAERLAASGFDKEELIAHGEAITAEVVPDARAIVDAFCTVVKDVVVKESV